MKINAIITGATGMVGEGVLHICLNHPDIDSVLIINRKICDVKHEKLKEIILGDFFAVNEIENQLRGYNACFFCSGVSSLGMKVEDYRKVTYDLTLNFANVLVKHNPEMTFCYVSGAGTDSSEKGRITWARVKGKTENDLLKLGFKDAYMFRPGLIQPIKGLKNTYKMYKVLAPLMPLIKALIPKMICSLEELGTAMINSALHGAEKKVLESKDIREMGRK
jgi:hypothetical protein